MSETFGCLVAKHDSENSGDQLKDQLKPQISGISLKVKIFQICQMCFAAVQKEFCGNYSISKAIIPQRSVNVTAKSDRLALLMTILDMLEKHLIYSHLEIIVPVSV